jgi:hypothetical protein
MLAIDSPDVLARATRTGLAEATLEGEVESP